MPLHRAIPARGRPKGPALARNPRPAPVSPGMAYPPVTPEVAGSSPVAPILKYMQKGIFRCLSRREFCSEIHRLLPEPVCARKSDLRTTCK